jgi:hypothetical protein
MTRRSASASLSCSKWVETEPLNACTLDGRRCLASRQACRPGHYLHRIVSDYLQTGHGYSETFKRGGESLGGLRDRAC